MSSIIKINNLSKKYQLGLRQPYYSLRDTIVGFTRIPFYKLKNIMNNNSLTKNEFWALKNVNLEIKEGEVVGIIGSNGAGKTTILKILSQITPPTKGEIILHGRVASMLEVGTGFHPELTGRENIFLNAAIMGMKRNEIRKKFDDIVEFSEIKKFIDTPVKHYSSGMYMRLAFAVAAHLESEILLVDEVLAVGDSAFQKKCLGKMAEINKQGRTVIFVSHNMATVESLCKRGIVLENGRVTFNGKTKQAVYHYLNSREKDSSKVSLLERKDHQGTLEVITSSIQVFDQSKQPVTVLQSGEDYQIEIGYLNKIKRALSNVVVAIEIFDELGNRIMLVRTTFTNNNLNINKEEGKIICKIKDLPLASGLYHLSVLLTHADYKMLDYLENGTLLKVEGGDYFGTGSLGAPDRCKILTRANWSVD